MDWLLRIGNPFVSLMLRSPFHSVFSRSLAILTITGWRTGRRYSTPVNYLLDGEKVWIISRRQRTWWRNLRGGAPVQLRLAGRELEMWAQVAEDVDGVAAALLEIFRIAPAYARAYGLALDGAGDADPAELKEVAARQVVVLAEPRRVEQAESQTPASRPA